MAFNQRWVLSFDGMKEYGSDITYTWNAEDRPRTISRGGTITVIYDALGRLVAHVPEITTTFGAPGSRPVVGR